MALGDAFSWQGIVGRAIVVVADNSAKETVRASVRKECMSKKKTEWSKGCPRRKNEKSEEEQIGYVMLNRA